MMLLGAGNADWRMVHVNVDWLNWWRRCLIYISLARTHNLRSSTEFARMISLHVNEHHVTELLHSAAVKYIDSFLLTLKGDP